MFGISWVGLLNYGGYKNVLLPVYAWIAVVFGFGLYEAFKITEMNKKYFMNLVLLVLVICQYYVLRFPISSQIPTQQDRLAGNSLVNTISKSEGEVLIPSSNYLAFYAGKNTYFNSMALDEVTGFFGRPDVKQDKYFVGEIQKAIAERKFSLIIIDKYNTFNTGQLGSSYILEQKIFSDPAEFIPVTGWNIRPETLYIPSP
jgi:hypothetical protein